jgi:hypothetical protein
MGKRHAESAIGASASARGIAAAVTPGNNGEPAPLPRPRLALRPRRRAAPARAAAQNRRAPAPDAPSAAPCRRHRPSLFVSRARAATTRCATADGMISAHFGPRQRFHAAGGDHYSEWRYQPKLTVCTGGKGHPQPPRCRGAGRAAHCRRGKCHRQRKQTFCLVRRLCAVSASGRSRLCQQPSSVAEPYPNWRTRPQAAAVAVLCCCTGSLNYGAQDFELRL